MYWDLPPLESGKAKERLPNHGTDVENEKGFGEEDTDEEKPLMDSQELLGSYGSVVASSPSTHHITTASNGTLSHVSPPCTAPPDLPKSSSPSKNVCMSRGEWLAVHVSF